MTSKEHLIEQHILEWEARRKHVDELYVRAHEAVEHLDDDHASKAELERYARERASAHKKADNLKTMPPEKWREETVQSAGPMAIWDILAQKLEDFVERHE